MFGVVKIMYPNVRNTLTSVVLKIIYVLDNRSLLIAYLFKIRLSAFVLVDSNAKG